MDGYEVCNLTCPDAPIISVYVVLSACAVSAVAGHRALLSDLSVMCQVLQGYMFVGHVEELGGEVASAFTNAVNATVVQVVPVGPAKSMSADCLQS